MKQCQHFFLSGCNPGNITQLFSSGRSILGVGYWYNWVCYTLIEVMVWLLSCEPDEIYASKLHNTFEGSLAILWMVLARPGFFWPSGKKQGAKPQNSREKNHKLKLKTQFLAYFGKIYFLLKKNPLFNLQKKLKTQWKSSKLKKPQNSRKNHKTQVKISKFRHIHMLAKRKRCPKNKPERGTLMYPCYDNSPGCSILSFCSILLSKWK